MWPEGSLEESSTAACESRSNSFSRRFDASASPSRRAICADALVAELREPLQVFLDPLEHDGQIHGDITMTSSVASVKCLLHVGSRQRRRCGCASECGMRASAVEQFAGAARSARFASARPPVERPGRRADRPSASSENRSAERSQRRARALRGQGRELEHEREQEHEGRVLRHRVRPQEPQEDDEGGRACHRDRRQHRDVAADPVAELVGEHDRDLVGPASRAACPRGRRGACRRSPRRRRWTSSCACWRRRPGSPAPGPPPRPRARAGACRARRPRAAGTG